MTESHRKVFSDIESLSRTAAQEIIASSSEADSDRGRFLLALNGGGTPMRLFHLLAEEFSDQIEWGRTHVFWSDERCVPASDPESNYGQARDILLNRVPIPEANIHRIQGELEPAEAAREYSLLLAKFASAPLAWPRFDMVLLGMGEDGHTASLFPNSPVDSPEPVLAVQGNYQGRPASRVTLTPLVLNQARNVTFMVTGAAKAGIVSRVLGDRDERKLLPAQRIKPADGRCLWLLDDAAASQLSAHDS